MIVAESRSAEREAVPRRAAPRRIWDWWALALPRAARRPSMLVLTDMCFPGWTATVDGRPAGIEQVDYILRGVVVPAGTHQIEFRYRPVSWRIGWILSAVALLVLVSVTALGLRTRRRRLRPS